MGQLTCKYVLHHRAKLDGTRQVRLRLTRDGETRFVDTTLDVVPAKHWKATAAQQQAGSWLDKSFPDAANRNQQLREDLVRVQGLGTSHPTWTVAQIQERVKKGLGKEQEVTRPKEETDLVAYLAQDIARQTAMLAPRSLDVWRAVYNKVSAYAGEGGLPFADLTPGKVREMYTWFVTDPRCGVNQAKQQMEFVKTAVSRAVDDGLLEFHKHPFRKLSFPKEKRQERPRLTQAQTQLFLTAPLPITPKYPHANIPRMLLARQTWLLQYLLGGARIGDALELRWQNVQGARVVFVERKTGKEKRVKRNPVLDALLAMFHRAEAEPRDYVLPYLAHAGCRDWSPTNPDLLDALKRGIRKVNVGLRLLCTGLDLPVMTSHAARHTLLSHALESSQDISSVQLLANHSSETLTRLYTDRESDLQRRSDATLDAVVAALFNGTKKEQGI